MDILLKFILKIRGIGNMQVLFYFLEKSKWFFNVEYSEFFLLNVLFYCYNFFVMVFCQFKIGFRCIIFMWLCILCYLFMKNVFCEIFVRLFIYQFMCVGFCLFFVCLLGFFVCVFGIWFCLNIFFYFNFQGDVLFWVWYKVFCCWLFCCL